MLGEFPEDSHDAQLIDGEGQTVGLLGGHFEIIVFDREGLKIRLVDNRGLGFGV